MLDRRKQSKTWQEGTTAVNDSPISAQYSNIHALKSVHEIPCVLYHRVDFTGDGLCQR